MKVLSAMFERKLSSNLTYSEAGRTSHPEAFCKNDALKIAQNLQ